MASRRDFLLGGCVAAAAVPQAQAANPRKIELANRSLIFSLEVREGTPPSLVTIQNRESGFNWCPNGRESAAPHLVAAGIDSGKWSAASWTSSKSEAAIEYAARSG